VGDEGHVVLGQKFACEKGSVRRCIVMIQQPVLLSPKFGAVFTHFHAIAIKLYSSIWNRLFGLPGWILCEQSPWYEGKWWSCSWVCSSPVSPSFDLGDFGLSMYGSCILPRTLI
jgi:hypothetical protein